MTVSRGNNSEKRKKKKTNKMKTLKKEENLKRKLESFSSWSIKLKFYQQKLQTTDVASKF